MDLWTFYRIYVPRRANRRKEELQESRQLFLLKRSKLLFSLSSSQCSTKCLHIPKPLRVATTDASSKESGCFRPWTNCQPWSTRIGDRLQLTVTSGNSIRNRLFLRPRATRSVVEKRIRNVNKGDRENKSPDGMTPRTEMGAGKAGGY